MATLSELDPTFLKSLRAMHSRDHLLGTKPYLQQQLEDALRRAGKEVNLNSTVMSLMKHAGVEVMPLLPPQQLVDDASKCASDSELDLMLLKEDLACVVCQLMDTGARNRLLECSDCHALYHQECHEPTVSQYDADHAWMCGNCKEIKKNKKIPVIVHSSSSGSVTSSSSKQKSSSTSSPRPSLERSTSSSGHSSSYKTSSSSSSKGSKSSSSGSKSSSSGSKTSGTSSSKHTPVTTSSTIISADKRIQNMKKKAAKLHESKKKSSR